MKNNILIIGQVDFSVEAVMIKRKEHFLWYCLTSLSGDPEEKFLLEVDRHEKLDEE